MSSDNPPYPYYDGIPFNPSFFTSDSGSGLSEAQANAKYLRKTVPDTATSLETFNGGIITPSLSSTGSLDIVIPNALATDVLNVGVVSRNISGQIHHYSDGDNCVAGAGVHINNGINNASSTNIMNGTTTTGICNIMSGASSTGTTNIGATTSTLALKGTTSILGATSINTSGGLNTIIGTTNLGSVSLKGLTVTIAESTNVNIQTTNPSDNTKSTTIGQTNGPFSTLTTINGRLTTAGVTNINTSGTSATNIGIVGATTTIAGTTNINTSGTATTALGVQTSTVNLRGAVNINTNGTGGFSNTTIGVAGSVTAINGTTNINTSGGSTTTIGTSGSGTSAIQGSTVNVSGTTNNITGISNINTSGTATTTIGVTGSTTAINGAVNINTVAPTDNLITTTIGATATSFDTNTNINGKTTISKLTTNSIISTADFSITPPITDDIILQPSASSSGKIDIMTGASSTGSVNILTGNFASGIIDIGGESVTTNINGSTINIANTDDNSNTINILTGIDALGDINVMTGTGNTSTLTVGTTATTVEINGNTTIKKLTLTAPITSAYSVVPTSGQIGYVPSAVFYNAITEPNLKPNNATLTAFAAASLARIELTAGTWILIGSLIANANASSGYVICSITPTINAWNPSTDFTVQSLNHPTLNFQYVVSSNVQITSTASYYLTTRTNVSNQVVNTYRLTATRIA